MKPTRLTVAVAALAVLWGVTVWWGIGQLRELRQADVLLQNKYGRAFYETTQRTKNVEALLSKGLVSGSPDQMDAILSDLWYNANSAQENLSQLPVSHDVVARTSKFLSQVGGYAYTLTKSNKAGTLSDKDWGTMQQLYQSSVSLNKEMSTVEQESAAGAFHWTEVQSGLNETLPQGSVSSADRSFRKVETQLHELPVLVYDGPFSDHIEQMQPLGLTGGLVTLDQARDLARRFADLGGATVQQTVLASEVQGKIPSYTIQLHAGDKPTDVITVDVSKQGGQVVSLLNPRTVPATKLSDQQALSRAGDFLNSRGLTGFVSTYALRGQNIATVSFAYKQGNVVIYPDQVKLQVALDNGQILGYEALGYLTAHHQRVIAAPAISAETAKSKLSPRVQALSERLTLIPTSSKGEVLTYEFKTKLGNDVFLVYINAQNGEEEQILKLLNLPNGTLTL
jgi:germination protein YpeB